MPYIEELKISKSVSREERIIASKLFEARTRMDIERQDLAAMVGIDEVDLAEYENGIKAVPASELFMLATAMGISVNYFYDDEDADDTQTFISTTYEEEAPVLPS